MVGKVRFQAMFCATAALVFSAALGREVRPLLQLVFCAILALVVYPIFGRWVWGGGWLSDQGFVDFAGATVVYSIAGWSALPFLIARRWSKVVGSSKNDALAPNKKMWLYAIGATLVWFALAGIGLLEILETFQLSDITLATNLAALAGAVMAIVLSFAAYQTWRLHFAFAGCFAGIAAITACILSPDGTARGAIESVIIGAGAGSLSIFSIWLFGKLLFSDRLNVIPAFTIGGVWGTLYTGFSGMTMGLPQTPATFTSQLIGVATAFVWAGGVFGVVSGIAYWRGWLKDKTDTSRATP